MSDSQRTRPALMTTLAFSAVAFALVAAVSPGVARGTAPTPQASPSPPPQAVSAEGSWQDVERLIDEQKMEEARSVVASLRAIARATGNEDEWAKALVTEVQLRTALHGYETAVRFLRDEPWPTSPRARVALELFYGRALVTYVQAYSWEIARRERVDTQGVVDLKAWTKDQLVTEATRAYAEVWWARVALGDAPVSALAEFLQPNNYPPRIRGTLRDAVSYLFVELLADTSLWRPDHAADVYRLDLAALVRGAASGPGPTKLDDPASHPLVRIGAILDDLEGWHTRAGRREAALEARLERLRRLHESFTDADDRKRIRSELESRIGALRDLEWWSMGQAELAEMVRVEDAPDSLVRAHALAEKGRDAYPESLGGQRCLSIVRSIEAPDYSLAAMAADGARRRSIELTHRNLPKLHLRAYALDLVETIQAARDYNLLPNQAALREIVGERRANQSWSVDLPPTPDYRSHRTFVTPPLDAPGLYAIVASANADFTEPGNRIVSAAMVVSDLVLVTRPQRGGYEVACVMGSTGAPAGGTQVSLYSYDWQKGHRRVASQVAGRDGVVQFPHLAGRQRGSYFLFARRGDDVGVDQSWLGFHPEAKPTETSATLVYSDRSIYRPTQTIRWKLVAYQGGGETSQFRTHPQAVVSLQLVDANNQTVETKAVTTNAFGSASGEFVIPSGRALGQWWLRSSLGGQSAVRIEEYKRPTFEVKLLDPTAALRLNREAAFEGEARYYFGLPVTSGQVRWHVDREPVYPWWWGLWCWRCGRTTTGSRTIAAGTAEIDETGKLRIVFTPEADERMAESKEVSFRYIVRADVTDEGGETRSASRSFRLGFVSVEASLVADTGFFREHEPATLTARRTSLDGVPRPGVASWRVVVLRQPEATLLPADQPLPEPGTPNVVRTPGDALRPRWAPGYSPEAVLRSWLDGAEQGRGNLDHDEQGEATLTLPALAPGAYRIHYETTDDFGARYTTSKEVLVAGGATPVALPLLFEAERTSVTVGGTARFLVHSGLRGLPLTLDIERAGHRVERRTLVAGEGPSLVELPVRDVDRGGFGVTLTAVRDHQLMTLAKRVFVPWDDRELKLDFATFRDTLRPGAREAWRVTVRSPVGAPVEAGAAELLAYMYDRSLDVFAPHSPASPLSLYPTRTGTSWVRASLGAAQQLWLWDGGLGSVPSPPALFGDRLKYFDGYGIGGLGRLAGGVAGFAAKSAGAPMAPRAPAAEKAMLRTQAADALEEKDERVEEEARVSGAEPSPEPVPLRSDFSETAFWQPHLLTGADGSATIEFAVPDSVTSWNVWVHAVTRDLRGASIKKEARTVKELMVRPYLPRFLREADEAELKVVVNNAGEQPLSGQVTLEILDPQTNESRLGEFGVAAPAAKPFTVAPGGGASVTFPLTAPKGVRTVAFKVVARAGDFSDGELRPLPVLPGRVHLAQSRFVALKGAGRRTLRFADLERDDDPTRIDERLIVTLDAQLFYGVLQALPYLVSYPYECTEQTLNRFLSTGIMTSVFDRYPSVARMAQEMAKRETRLETWDAADPNRKMALEETPWLQQAKGGADTAAPLLRVLDPRIARAERESALAKLEKSQTSLGAFPWWPGGPPSPYMTLYILHGFSKGLEFGVDAPKDVIVKAWAYLHRHYVDEIVRESIEEDCCWELVTFLNFVLSSYPDASWTGGVFSDAERRTMLEFSFEHWREHSPYTKAYLALTLQRMGRGDDATLVFDSIMDSAKTDPDLGTYWAPEDRAWLWYNDTIETHAFVLRALMELRPNDARREGLVQWLFLNKQLNHWKSTRATAEAIYALVHYLEAESALGVREDARVRVGGRSVDFVFDPDRYTGKTNRVVLEGREIDPRNAATTVVEKQSPGIVFASATWHFSTERLPEEGRGDLFGVSRSYFRREKRGSEWVLAPLAEGATVSPGDEIEIQLSVRARHAAEYVHLRDPRLAGLEPGVAVSRYKWELGIGWYEEVRDSGTNFFFEWLPAGEYTLKYRVRAAMAGRFRAGPATLQSMYAPEFTAYSSGARLTVSAR